MLVKTAVNGNEGLVLKMKNTHTHSLTHTHSHTHKPIKKPSTEIQIQQA